MNKFGFRWMALALISALVLAVQAQAGPVVVGFTSNDPYGYTVSSTDLLEGLTPAAGSVLNTADEEGLGSDPTGAALTNGTFGPGVPPQNQPGTVPDMTIIHDGTSLIYDLPTPADIGAIRTYTGWRDSGRADQNYTVFYSTDGTSFTKLLDVNYTSTGGSPTNTMVDITQIPSGWLAQDVKALRFDFPTTENGYVGYREIDVFGMPLPEPASVTLLGIGIAGLAVARRRRAASC